ncbi:hypothetical protein FB446DRAFT_709514 [Lentinula raphanica]|nr:hypothetical protein FB446DRAFT_709514 [Lentinula raphanica]
MTSLLGSIANLVEGQTLGDLYLSNIAQLPYLVYNRPGNLLGNQAPQHFRLVQHAFLLHWNGLSVEFCDVPGPLNQVPQNAIQWQLTLFPWDNVIQIHPAFAQVSVMVVLNRYYRQARVIPPAPPAHAIPILAMRAGNNVTPMYCWPNRYDAEVRSFVPPPPVGAIGNQIFYAKHVRRDANDHGSNDELDMAWWARTGGPQGFAVLKFYTQSQSARLGRRFE